MKSSTKAHIAGRRVLGVTMTSIVFAGVAVSTAGSAMADDYSWQQLNPGDNIDGNTANISQPGYRVLGVLGNGGTELAPYANPVNPSTGGYCVIAGLPYSQVADVSDSIDINDPVTLYALSFYGDSTDRDTVAAVSLIAHIRQDMGTDTVSPEKRRAAFQESLNAAPQGVKDKYNQIMAEAGSYKDPGSTATTVNVTGNPDGTGLKANIDLPDGHKTVVTLKGTATFEDGSTTKTIDSDQTLPLVSTAKGEYKAGEVEVTADPEGTAKKVDDRIHMYQQNPQDRSHQVMLWAKGSEQDLAPATGKFEYRTPVTPANLGTVALDGSDGDKVINPGGTVKDTVAYDGLVPGENYIVRGTIMDQKSGKSTDVIAEQKFTPTAAKGSVDVNFQLPKDFPNGDYVVFETMSLIPSDGSQTVEVGRHHDQTDQKQFFSVVPPSIGTTATDKADGDKYMPQTGGTLVDAVAYKGLSVNKEYTVSGTLMDQATGKELLGDDGKPVTATAKFTPKETNGNVTLDFQLPATAAGKTIVAFETISQGTTPIAVHADINDQGQTVKVGDLHTNASDQSDGDKTVVPGGQIVDKISYTNLVPGATYTVNGTIFNKTTGQLTDIKSTGTLVADEDGTGTFDLTFQIPADAADGTYVVFEQALDAKGQVYAKHENKDDKDQTFQVKTPGTPSQPGTPAQPAPHHAAPAPSAPVTHMVKTGGELVESNPGMAALAGIGALGAAGALGYASYRVVGKRKETSDSE